MVSKPGEFGSTTLVPTLDSTCRLPGLCASDAHLGCARPKRGLVEQGKWASRTCEFTSGSRPVQLKSVASEHIWSIATYREIAICSSGGPSSYCLTSVAISLSALPTTSATTRDDLRSRCP